MKGGKRKGAGRPYSEATKQMRVPISMESAVNALKRISAGKSDPADIAELMLLINIAVGDGFIHSSDLLDKGVDFLEKQYGVDYLNNNLEKRLNQLRSRVKKFNECGEI